MRQSRKLPCSPCSVLDAASSHCAVINTSSQFRSIEWGTCWNHCCTVLRLWGLQACKASRFKQTTMMETEWCQFGLSNFVASRLSEPPHCQLETWTPSTHVWNKITAKKTQPNHFQLGTPSCMVKTSSHLLPQTDQKVGAQWRWNVWNETTSHPSIFNLQGDMVQPS